jgi:hypothetical protein
VPRTGTDEHPVFVRAFCPLTDRGIRRAPNGACPGMQRLWRMGGATATDRSRCAMWEPKANHIASRH